MALQLILYHCRLSHNRPWSLRTIQLRSKAATSMAETWYANGLPSSQALHDEQQKKRGYLAASYIRGRETPDPATVAEEKGIF